MDDPAQNRLAAPGHPSAAARTPRVSVLIPTYNQEQFIGHAIMSALAQDYPSLEVIVADDASTDGTGQIAAARMDDSRLRYVRNETRLGRLPNYRHALYELARGDWVVMLDGDDYFCDPSFISRACRAIDGHPDRPIVFVQAGQRVHWLFGQTPDVDVLPPIPDEEIVLTGAEYLRVVMDKFFFSHAGTLYNRRAAIATAFYSADTLSSDMNSVLRLSLQGDVVLLKAVVACWVRHEGAAGLSISPSDIAPVVRQYRPIVDLAVSKGLATWAEFEEILVRFEDQTLTSLVRAALSHVRQDNARLLADNARLSQDNARLLEDHARLTQEVSELKKLSTALKRAPRLFNVTRAVVRTMLGWPRDSESR